MSSEPNMPLPAAYALRKLGRDLALAVAGRFGIKAPAAKSILHEVLTAVSAWRRTGGRLRLKGATLDAYASAFEHELMEEARSVLGK